jgi:Zn finger protein HypA/HybF involved in hydrogenase expression
MPEPIPTPAPPVTRYAIHLGLRGSPLSHCVSPEVVDDGEWCKWSDVQAILLQRAQEIAALKAQLADCEQDVISQCEDPARMADACQSCGGTRRIHSHNDICPDCANVSPAVVSKDGGDVDITDDDMAKILDGFTESELCGCGYRQSLHHVDSEEGGIYCLIAKLRQYLSNYQAEQKRAEAYLAAQTQIWQRRIDDAEAETVTEMRRAEQAEAILLQRAQEVERAEANAAALVKDEAIYRENEQHMLRKLSRILTNGNAGTWDELEHASLQRAQAIAALEAVCEQRDLKIEQLHAALATLPASAALQDSEPYLPKDECLTPDLLRKIANNFERGYFAIPQAELGAGPSHWTHALRQRADQLEAALRGMNAE